MDKSAGNNVLLCSFVNTRDAYFALDAISKNYAVMDSAVYVLNDESSRTQKNNISKFILSYNVGSSRTNYSDIIRGTIQVHRKKEHNILYTLNALNKLIWLHGRPEDISENQWLQLQEDVAAGKEDYPEELDDFIPPWEDYANSLILTDKDNNIRVIPTSLNFIANVNH